MRTRSKLNPKILSVVLSLIIISVIFACNFDKFKDMIKALLESGMPTIIIWCYIIGTFTVHRFVLGSNESEDSFIFSHFGKYADTVLAVVTYGLSSSTSLALIKGLYLQFFFKTVFYQGFNVFDLGSMFVLSTFLLIYSMFATTRTFLDLIFYSHLESIEVND